MPLASVRGLGSVFARHMDVDAIVTRRQSPRSAPDVARQISSKESIKETDTGIFPRGYQLVAMTKLTVVPSDCFPSIWVFYHKTWNRVLALHQLFTRV